MQLLTKGQNYVKSAPLGSATIQGKVFEVEEILLFPGQKPVFQITKPK